ncbi:prephenate dehydratase [Luteibaculum oceani]|uniref:prephenate dehydratase n=1 Tax=Luteibaculum oceani TaxID=1294296 RepID=A0A5C6UUW5_9FLAO|nr:prephenate dehydratase domain-containing protein [Luteibaculum oceani]TXC76041.1 prephenate dehydratase [Luteibaculum oceani]
MKLKIAIQGIKGAFHEEAAIRAFGENIECLCCQNFPEVIKALDGNEADYAVMAIENTISGTILNNYNLIREGNCEMVGEVFVPIKQYLGAIPGSTLTNLREVRSHYMALNQCRDFFEAFPKIDLVEARDTAFALKEIATLNDPGLAAIGSINAIKEYGLEVLANNIQSNQNNITRFAILGKESEPVFGNKISLSVILQDTPGALANLLTVVHKLKINLTKIVSVPIPDSVFRYRFYLEIVLPSPHIFESSMHEISFYLDDLEILGRYNSSPCPTPKFEQNDNILTPQLI